MPIKHGTASLLAGLGLIGLLLVALVVMWAYGEYKEVFREDYRRLEAVEVGMTESQVRELLGEPHQEYEAGTAPEDYYVEGWAYKRRPITNKVFIYHGGEPILYVWFDEENRVEEVFVGGS